MQVSAPQYVARAWVAKENRFVLGYAQGNGCAACNNTCPCSKPSPDKAQATPQSFGTMWYDSADSFKEVQVSVKPILLS